MTQKQTNEEKYIDIPLDDDVEWDKYPLDDDEIFEYLIAENTVMYMANNQKKLYLVKRQLSEMLSCHFVFKERTAKNGVEKF